MASFKIVEFTLSSALATSGTVTVTYPTGTDAGWFRTASGHTLQAVGGTFNSPTDFAITSWGAASATLTWRNAATLPAGTTVRLQLNIPGPETYRDVPPTPPATVRGMYPYRIILGTPITADADGVTSAQLLAAAGNLTLDGPSVSGGVAVLDVPRNFTLTVATTNQSGVTFTVTGTDVYGNTMVETLAGPNNNTVAGKKAFKTITQVAASAAVATNGVSVGFGDVLGLPVYLPSAAHVVSEVEDGAAASSGTIVAGLSPATVSTATTADVRGTYDPNSAADGAKAFELFVLLSEPDALGNPQYAG